MIDHVTRYAITVDTEEEWDWNSGWPTQAASVENIRELPRFQEICDRFQASVTYFTNYPVIQNAGSREIVRQLASNPGVEIGMHIHPWNTPPLDESTCPRPPAKRSLANLPGN